jgi:hypothetical protein
VVSRWRIEGTVEQVPGGLNVDGIFYDVAELQKHVQWMERQKQSLRRRLNIADKGKSSRHPCPDVRSVRDILSTGVEETKKISVLLKTEMAELEKALKVGDEKENHVVADLKLTVEILNKQLEEVSPQVNFAGAFILIGVSGVRSSGVRPRVLLQTVTHLRASGNMRSQLSVKRHANSLVRPLEFGKGWGLL